MSAWWIGVNSFQYFGRFLRIIFVTLYLKTNSPRSFDSHKCIHRYFEKICCKKILSFVQATNLRGIVGNLQVTVPGPRDFREIWVNIAVSTRHYCFWMNLYTYLTYWLITGYPDFLSRLSLALLFFQTHDLSRNSCIWNSRKWS